MEAPAGGEAPGFSEKRLPSSPSTSSNTMRSGRKSKSWESVATRQNTGSAPQDLGSAAGVPRQKASDHSFPLMGEVFAYAQFALFLESLAPRDHLMDLCTGTKCGNASYT